MLGDLQRRFLRDIIDVEQVDVAIVGDNRPGHVTIGDQAVRVA